MGTYAKEEAVEEEGTTSVLERADGSLEENAGDKEEEGSENNVAAIGDGEEVENDVDEEEAREGWELALGGRGLGVERLQLDHEGAGKLAGRLGHFLKGYEV